jgi:hypothetical protein
MELQEQQLLLLNSKILKLLPETPKKMVKIIVLRNTRDSILKAYVAAGGTGWFGNY